MKQCQYQKHDLVYAKIRGYPWWPGIIAEVKPKTNESGEKKYEFLINFIGDNSHSNLQEDKIRKFTISEGDQKIKKPKKLQMSISIASDIFSGKYTYQDWKGKDQKQKKQGQQKGKKGKKQVHFEDSSETEEEGESSWEKESEIQELLHGEAEKGNLKLLDPMDQEKKRKRRRSSVSMEEELIGKNKKKKTDKVIEDSEEEKQNNNNKAAAAGGGANNNAKRLNIPGTNLLTSNSNSSNNSSTADHSSTPFFVANTTVKKTIHGTTTPEGGMHVIETEDDEEEEAGGKGGGKIAQNISTFNSTQNQKEIVDDKLADLSANTLKHSHDKLEQSSSSQMLSSKQSTEPSGNPLQQLKLTSQTSLPSNSRKSSAIQTTKKDNSAVSSTKLQEVGEDKLDHDENNKKQEDKSGLDSLQNAVSQQLTKTGKLSKKKSKNPKLLKTLQTSPSIDAATNGSNIPKIALPSPVKKKKISKKSDANPEKKIVRIYTKKFSILKKRNLDLEQAGKTGAKVNSNTFDGALDLNQLISRLQSQNSSEIAEGFTKLTDIIKRIQDGNPQETNIIDILESHNGKLLSYARALLFDSSQQNRFILATGGDIQRFEDIRNKLNGLIVLLQNLLLKKYFDHESKCFEIKSNDSLPQKEGKNQEKSIQQQQSQSKSHPQVTLIEEEGDSNRETPLTKNQILSEESSKKGSIQSVESNVSVKQHRKQPYLKQISDFNKSQQHSLSNQEEFCSQKKANQSLNQSRTHHAAEKSEESQNEEKIISSFNLNIPSPFYQDPLSETVNPSALLKDADFTGSSQFGNNHELNKNNLELSNLSEELKVMRRKIVLKIIKSLNRILHQQALVQNYAKSIETMIREIDLSMGKKYKETCKNLITFISSSDFSTSQERIELYIAAGDPQKFSTLDLKSDLDASKSNLGLNEFQILNEGNRKLSGFSAEEENIQTSSESQAIHKKGDKMDAEDSNQNNNHCCVNEVDDDEEEIEESCEKADSEQQSYYNKNTTNTPDKHNTNKIHNKHENHKLHQEEQLSISPKKSNKFVEVTHNNSHIQAEHNHKHHHSIEDTNTVDEGSKKQKNSSKGKSPKKQHQEQEDHEQQGYEQQFSSSDKKRVLSKDGKEVHGDTTDSAVLA